MHPQNNANLSYKEGNIEFALHAYASRQFPTLQRAAAAFGVQHQRRSDRLNKITYQPQDVRYSGC
jgi:hypothetical protein